MVAVPGFSRIRILHYNINLAGVRLGSGFLKLEIMTLEKLDYLNALHQDIAEVGKLIDYISEPVLSVRIETLKGVVEFATKVDLMVLVLTSNEKNIHQIGQTAVPGNYVGLAKKFIHELKLSAIEKESLCKSEFEEL